jgi:hypothetical protein
MSSLTHMYLLQFAYLSQLKHKLKNELKNMVCRKEILRKYEDRSESKERFAIQRYLLIIGKKQNMQVL